MAERRRVSIVTGGAQGIGAAVARRLAGAGDRVVIVDVDAESACRLAAEIGPLATAVRADVADEDGVREYMDAAATIDGRVDRVLLNAGVGSHGPLADESVDRFDRTIAVNLRGAFLGMRAALRQMRAQGRGGSIVATASTAGLSGSELGSYSASKHGVVALVKSAALEAAAFGVRVNAVAPGSIDTPLMRLLEARLGGGEAAARRLRAATPLGRWQDRYGTPEEVAAAVEFLLGDGASWITGVVLAVDGGVLAADPYHLELQGP
ncbi:MAG TPA: SDR family NAD(P)-dependent oxidoreductase [Solirubrobacteraceae bacterium]|nr:SDR family NAD(P)-dependent oxidoreductase [Solirubrobacteraceae bacterium]